jgi:hypothetical protein
MSTLKHENKFSNKTQIFNLPLSTHSENTNSVFWIAIKPVVTEHTRYIEVDTRRNYKKKESYLRPVGNPNEKEGNPHSSSNQNCPSRS